MRGLQIRTSLSGIPRVTPGIAQMLDTLFTLRFQQRRCVLKREFDHAGLTEDDVMSVLVRQNF